MRALSLLGVGVFVLGILSFAVPVPVSKTREFKAGDASVGITTKQDEKLSPFVGGALCILGATLMLAGTRKATA